MKNFKMLAIFAFSAFCLSSQVFGMDAVEAIVKRNVDEYAAKGSQRDPRELVEAYAANAFPENMPTIRSLLSRLGEYEEETEMKYCIKDSSEDDVAQCAMARSNKKLLELSRPFITEQSGLMASLMRCNRNDSLSLREMRDCIKLQLKMVDSKIAFNEKTQNIFSDQLGVCDYGHKKDLASIEAKARTQPKE